MLLIFSTLAINDLGADKGDYTALKYASIIAIMLSIMLIQGFKKSFDHISVTSLGFFIFSSAFFTTINSPDTSSLSLIMGYFVCLIIYTLCSSASATLLDSIENFLIITSIAFIIVNIPQVFNPESYSPVKNQFSGILKNANAFAGLCGFLFVFCFCKFQTHTKATYRTFYLTFSASLAIYLLLSSSRGAILASIIAIWIIPFNKRTKLLITVIATTCIIAYVFFLKNNLSLGFAGRDIFEETGRADLFSLYAQEIIKNLFIGVGLSENGGRIKSELSYMDIALFSGIGALGFFSFILRGVYFSITATINSKKFGFHWSIPVFIYICIASIFEGYAANIASLPSIFLYISAGFVFQKYKFIKASNHRSNP